MANLNKLLLAGGFPPGNNSLNHFDKLFAQKVGDSGVITTATGNPVSIITNKAQNAISTLLSYSPKQTGQGDPSPTNIRPIEGWTEANLGVNSETPTITANLGGTYYGFSIDLERGVLRVTHRLLTIDNTKGAIVAGIGGMWIVDGLVTFYSDLDRLSICNSFVKIPRKLNTSDFKNNSVIGDYTGCSASEHYDRLFFRDERFATTSELNAYLAENPVHILERLKTDLTYNLTPQTVALLAGNNTLWCDGDSLSVTYKAKKA